REKLRRCYDNELTAFGLSRALAELMDIEGPSVVRLLDQLSASGLVVRRPDPDDQRGRTLHLTPAGVELAERIKPVVERLRRQLLANASDADLETCLRVFADFLAACERDGMDVTK
ncbi:MAG TPA: MarR family transcriptional regulator, partial [Gemmatimonadaceae bacterium]|nr:MarR family transcriptional regulator [Gemmatimonadaceae bacterium]